MKDLNYPIPLSTTQLTATAYGTTDPKIETNLSYLAKIESRFITWLKT